MHKIWTQLWMEKAQPISYAFFPPSFSSKWELSRIGTIRRDSHPVLGRAMVQPFNQMSVDLESTRELVRNVSSQPQPGNLQYAQAPRGSSVLRFEICCSREYSLACIFGGSWRANLKMKNILPCAFLSIFLIDSFGMFGRNKDRVHEHTL